MHVFVHYDLGPARFLLCPSNLFQGLWKAWQKRQRMQPRKSSMTGWREKNNDCLQMVSVWRNTIPPASRNFAMAKWKGNSRVVKTCSPQPHTQLASIPMFGHVGWRLFLHSWKTGQPRTAKLDILQFPKGPIISVQRRVCVLYISLQFFTFSTLFPRDSRRTQRPALPFGQFCLGMLRAGWGKNGLMLDNVVECCKERKHRKTT